jgi:hypothetical protein
MFKKVIFVKNNKELSTSNGSYQWSIHCSNNLFFYSRNELEANNWYEIIYYRGNNGVFRINEARLISYQPSQTSEKIQINQNIFINQQQNIFLMNDKFIEIIDQDYKTRFFSTKFNKYILYGCPSSCWTGFFCNNCEIYLSDDKGISELKSDDYLWVDKANPRKLVHKKTWMAPKLT